MKRLAAVLLGGPPATGKSTLAAALAPHLDAAILDLDVATGPLTRVVSELIGVRDLHDPVLAGLTRDARYDTLLGLAEAKSPGGPARRSRRALQRRAGAASRLGCHRAANRGRPRDGLAARGARGAHPAADA